VERLLLHPALRVCQAADDIGKEIVDCIALHERKNL
jgi:hypothetical protein